MSRNAQSSSTTVSGMRLSSSGADCSTNRNVVQRIEECRPAKMEVIGPEASYVVDLRWACSFWSHNATGEREKSKLVGRINYENPLFPKAIHIASL